MEELNVFRNPGLDVDLPKELSDNKFEVFSCLKINDGYAAYLLTSEGTDRRLLLKRSTDPVISLGLANEKKLLDIIHRHDDGELARSFPSTGFFSTDGDVSWYMRDYIRGRTLSELVEQSSGAPGLPRNQALGYVIQVVELLRFIHSLDPPIIHRDVKPQNVVVDNEGVCHLIDMGISRIYSDQKGEDTVVMGTRATMPPEQFGYQQTDQRSDLYSVGVLLLYCLSGDYSALDTDLKEIDPDIAEVIRRSTQFDPNMRYQSAQEMLDALLLLRYGTSPAGVIKKKSGSALTAILAAVTIVLALSIYPAVRYFSNSAAKKARDEILNAKNVAYEFKEPLIEQAVRKMLEKPDGDITLSDLENVTDLAIFGNQPLMPWDPVVYMLECAQPIEAEYWQTGLFRERGNITSLEDIRQMPNLGSLKLYNQEITDISLVSEMPKIWNLCVCDCPIADYSFLADSEISNLSVAFQDIDISELIAEMPRLENLDISYTKTSDISAFKDLKLYILSISGCPIKDLSPLNDMAYLIELNMSYDFEEIVKLDRCTAQRLELRYNGDVSFEGLDKLIYIERLGVQCDSSEKSGIYVPEGFTMPKVSSLHFNGDNLVLEDFSVFKGLPRLTELHFTFTDARGFKGLDELPMLKVIQCSDEARGAINALYPNNTWRLPNG